MASRYDSFVGPRIAHLYDMATKIFDLENHDWEYLRRNMTAQQVKDFYIFYNELWPQAMELEDYLPEPSNSLRGLYIGNESARTIEKKIARYSLYVDEILISLPFLNPRNLRDDFNPIKKPQEFLQNTLSCLAFLYRIGPWIKCGKVLPITNPINYNYALQKFVLENGASLEAMPEHKKLLELDMEDEDIFGFMKDDLVIAPYLRLPKEARIAFLHRLDPKLSTKELSDYADTMGKMRSQDPFILNQDITGSGSEFSILQMGSTVEVGEYICSLTGSFMYTDSNYHWKRMLETIEKDDSPSPWPALTEAFQKLSFNFLDDVDTGFAIKLIKDGRLSSFRDFLRELWAKLDTGTATQGRHESARLLEDKLTIAYATAMSEWKDIDRELLDWIKTGGAASILSGIMGPNMPLYGFMASGVAALAKSTSKRRDFMRTVPMAVMLDLNKYKRNIKTA